MKFIKKAKRGFTLVELVVVIAVIAILAAVSVGAYFGVTDSANNSKLEQEAKMVHTNIQLVGSDTSSNHVLSRSGLKIDRADIFETKFLEMSGVEYNFVYGETPTTIEAENSTVYFFIKNNGASNQHTPNTVYTHFGYYVPSIAGKRCDVNIVTGDSEIIKDLDFNTDNNVDDEPEVPTQHECEWNEGVITVQPTCTTVGTKLFTCTKDSSHTKTEEVAIVLDAHKWNEGEITVDPTCSEEGTKTFTCEYNSEHTKIESVDVDGNAHDWDEGKITTPSTCTSEGKKTYTCNNDPSHTKIEDLAINPEAHNIVTLEGKEATCTEVGLTEGSKCDLCNTTFTAQETIEALQHKYNSSITKDPTCTEKGTITHVCDRGDHAYTEEIPAKGHTLDLENVSYVLSKDKTVVTATTTCTECKESVSEAAEAIKSEQPVSSLTCTTDEIYTYTATFKTEGFDDYSENIVTVEHEGHTWDEGKCLECQTICQHINKSEIESKVSTCTEKGYKKYKCEVCEVILTEELDLAAHTPVTISGKPATCTETGLTEGSKCNVCGTTLTAQETIPLLSHNYIDSVCECGQKETGWIFLKPNANWKTDNAKFNAHF